MPTVKNTGEAPSFEAMREGIKEQVNAAYGNMTPEGQEKDIGQDPNRAPEPAPQPTEVEQPETEVEEQPRPPTADAKEAETDGGGDDEYHDHTQKRIDRLLADRAEHRDARADAESELARLQAENEALKRGTERKRDVDQLSRSMDAEELPENFEEMGVAEQIRWAQEKAYDRLKRDLGPELDEIKSVRAERRVLNDFPELSRTEVQATLDVMGQYGGSMDPVDAVILARGRNPDLFGGQGSHGEAQPSSLHVQKPGARTPAPRKDPKRDAKGRYVEALKTRNKQAITRAGVDLVRSTFLS